MENTPAVDRRHNGDFVRLHTFSIFLEREKAGRAAVPKEVSGVGFGTANSRVPNASAEAVERRAQKQSIADTVGHIVRSSVSADPKPRDGTKRNQQAARHDQAGCDNIN